MFAKYGSKVYITSGKHAGKKGTVIIRWRKDIYQIEVCWKLFGLFKRSTTAMLKQTEFNVL